MIDHHVRVSPSADRLPRERQLAWALAEIATADAPVDTDAAAMVANRVIDNAAVAVASLSRRPVAVARAQATPHRMTPHRAVAGASSMHGCAVNWPVLRMAGRTMDVTHLRKRCGTVPGFIASRHRRTRVYMPDSLMIV